MVEVSKRDWKLFREKLPGWQKTGGKDLLDLRIL